MNCKNCFHCFKTYTAELWPVSTQRIASKPVTFRKHQFIDVFLKAFNSFIEKILINLLVQEMRFMNTTCLTKFTLMCALHFTWVIDQPVMYTLPDLVLWITLVSQGFIFYWVYHLHFTQKLVHVIWYIVYLSVISLNCELNKLWIRT